MSIQVEDAGFLTTVQDLGRPGYRHLGATPGGALDQQAAVLSNALLGNAPSKAVLECTLAGPCLRFTASAWICLMGAHMQTSCESRSVDHGRVFFVKAGQRLSLGYARNGCRSYLAIRGGIDVPLVMGSASTFLRGGFGGCHGRALQAGDRLAVAEAPAGDPLWEGWYASPSLTDYLNRTNCIRYFPDINISDLLRQRFEEQSFMVSHQSDRMGYRLTGKALTCWFDHEPLSEGVCAGTIQLPADGQPIVLMNDCQTTGGYPVLGQVITVDLAKIAQLKSGDSLHFVPVTLEEARTALKQQQQDRARLAIAACSHWRQNNE